MNKVNLHPWSLDSRLRLLLEGVDHPDIRVDLDRVKHTKSIAAISRGNLKDTAIDAVERLCLLRLSALGGNGERVEHVALDVFREFLEVPARSLDPGDFPTVAHSRYVSKFANIQQEGQGSHQHRLDRGRRLTQPRQKAFDHLG